jgi:hypothetical protein
MNLYIEVENNLPKNHPAFENNLIEAFGNIPDNWVLFNRIDIPLVGVYEIYEGVTYELINGAYTDVHHVRSMTTKEIEAKKSATVTAWENRYPSWVFDESLCLFEPPVAYPQDGKIYRWDESVTNWTEVV